MKTLFLAAVLCTFFVAPVSAALPGGEALAELILGEFDSNADSKLDAGEWQNGVGGSFDKMDGNADGSITEDEAGAFESDISNKIGSIGATLVVTLIKKVLMSLDGNKDSLVSRAEYDKLSTDMFSKLDADKDSFSTKAELADLPLKLVGA
jgi:hypothetical protein